MNRVAFKMKLKNGCFEEYKKRHNEIWPELVKLLSDAGISNYKPELALKYVDNVLSRYEKDGLAFQRYGRINQVGLGDDILSGNSLALVGLYKAIYGINPLYNRL